MGWAYRNFIRPALFALDSETIHHRTLRALSLACATPGVPNLLQGVYKSPSVPVRLWGLDFPNPVGLAAGMDKFCEAVPIWEKLGFGFAELGGITALKQPGNDKPRMFRAPADGALINRMGFNNPGSEEAERTLTEWHARRSWPRHPIGINLGKSKNTPLDAAAEDYATSIERLWRFADFFVINVSSPNTPNLRQLQDRDALDRILAAAQQVNAQQAKHYARAPRPILVKVAPDLTFEALDEILELAGPRDLSGIVATNTTIARPDTTSDASLKTFQETGGLSGCPLAERSLEVVRHLYQQTKGTLPIIGVGGIFSGDDAWNKIIAGASLVQIYTGLVYEGPGLPATINRFIARKLRQLNLTSIQQAVGLEHRR